MNTAYIIGNGLSRKKHSLGALARDKNVTTFGCNVLFRDYPADYLVANDALVIYEIVRNDYTESKCLFTDWNPIPRDHEESLTESFTNQGYTVIRGGNENRGDMFSLYGWEPTNTVYVLYSQSIGTPYSKFTPIISEEASTGIHAIDAACQDGHTKIKCIGFDSIVEGNYRNLYEGTENYRRDGEKYTPQKAALWKEHHSLIKKHYEKVEIEYLP